MGSSFTEKIDMTRRAQRQRRLEDDESLLEEPEPKLPETSVDELPQVIQQAATAMGWNELTPVQAKAIPYLMEKRDLIVQAQTGTGKTGAFLLPLMQQLDPTYDPVQALVINPTRELARQTFEEFMKMKVGSPDTNQMYGALVYGGVGYKKQIEDMKKADIVVGTPGRLLDHLKKGNLDISNLRHLIIDEADELLSMGFYPDIEEIINDYTPEERHSSLYSATVPYRIQLMAEEFLKDPGYLSLSEEQVHADKIHHSYYIVPRLEKDDALRELIEHENPDSALIFANTKRDVRYVAQFLQNKGYDADQISGDLKQKDREKVMGRIREGELRFLVATDVAARGIDISDLSHVFLYDVPQDREFYIHRSGRTARAGKSGQVVVLATIYEKAQLKEISQHYDIEFERRELPSQQTADEEDEGEESGETPQASTTESAPEPAESSTSAPTPESSSPENGTQQGGSAHPESGDRAEESAPQTEDGDARVLETEAIEERPVPEHAYRNPEEAPGGTTLRRLRAPRGRRPGEPAEEEESAPGAGDVEGSGEKTDQPAEASERAETNQSPEAEADDQGPDTRTGEAGERSGDTDAREAEPQDAQAQDAEPDTAEVQDADVDTGDAQDAESSEPGDGQTAEAEGKEAGRSDESPTPPPPEKAERALEEWLLAQERSPESDWNAYISLAERFARDASKQHLAMLIEDWAESHVSGKGGPGSEDPSED